MVEENNVHDHNVEFSLYTTLHLKYREI